MSFFSFEKEDVSVVSADRKRSKRVVGATVKSIMDEGDGGDERTTSAVG